MVTFVLGSDTVWVVARIESMLRAYFEAKDEFVFALVPCKSPNTFLLSSPFSMPHVYFSIVFIW